MTKFGILGPVVLTDGEHAVPIARRQQTVLAYLLMHANRAVPAERMAEDLWPETDGSGKSLQVAVTRLRKALAGELRTVGGGYMLVVRPGELDADVFEELVERGQRALDAGDAAGAAGSLRAALDLWRGAPLGEVAYEAFAQGEVRRLEELRHVAVEARIAADLQLGRHAALAPELERLVAAEPAREGLAGHLMIALYRSGRQAEALEVYRRTRAHLADELGLEPGPELSALQARVLAQAPELDLVVAPTAGRLPPRPAEVIGREADVAAVTRLLEAGRLVTVVGIGGVGKTTLALEIAHRYAGAVFAELAAVGDAAGVPDVVIRALGGVPDPEGSSVETLRRLVAGRNGLLVLDNFEHVTAACPVVADLLAAASGLKVLVTSRAVLGLRGEQRYPLEPLALGDAAALFVQRARAHDPGFEADEEAIDEVCRRVAALPLAIELAAARAGMLSPGEIAARLGEGLGRGPVDAPERQQTLEATLDWSHRLLSEAEAAAFARLSVFAGGCTVDAAEAVVGAGLETLEQLVAKSMVVRRRTGGTTRLALLEPVREYAAARLDERGDREATERRHGEHYLGLAQELEDDLRAGDQVGAGRRLDADAANLRAALAWARDNGEVTLLLEACTGIDEWWFDSGLWSEGVAWLEWGLENSTDAVDPALRGFALVALAYLLWPEADIARTEGVLDRALALFESVGERQGMVWVNISRAITLSYEGRPAAARYAAEAVRLAEGSDDRTYGSALRTVAVTATDPQRAREATDRAAIHLERSGDVRTLARLWEDAGYDALLERDLDRARDLVDRALALSPGRDDLAEMAATVAMRGLVAVERGDADAAEYLHAALLRSRETGIRTTVTQILGGLAVLAARAGDHARAARLTGAARATWPPRFTGDALDERLEAAARAGCPPDLWEREVAAGEALDFNAAIELGLRPWGEADPPKGVHGGIAGVRAGM
jgi:predicted ATPase/DNA-binding SARP family transcriptional activator